VGTTTARPEGTVAGLLSSAWPMRVAWFLLAVVAAPGLGQALDGRSEPVQWLAAIGSWGGWTVGLVAALVPTTVSLTALRILAPGAVGVVALALVAAGGAGPAGLAALGAAVVVTMVAFLASTGDVMINGSAYGPERRMALRPPAPLVVGPVQVVWLAVFAGAVSGPLLVAAGQLAAGIPLTAVGAAVAAAGCRSLHRLSKRWAVFVPAGFVLHDQFTLAESVLIRRPEVVRLGPARRDDLEGAADLTAGARGLALEVQLRGPVKLGLRQRSAQVRSVEADRLVFTPSLPGALLAEARARGLPVG
jgi:hypothetical protein